MEELKPCPFCGGEAKIGKSNQTGLWGVLCRDMNDCRGIMENYLTREGVLNAWNTRTEHPDLDKLRAENKRLNDLVRKQGVELIKWQSLARDLGLKNRSLTPSVWTKPEGWTIKVEGKRHDLFCSHGKLVANWYTMGQVIPRFELPVECACHAEAGKEADDTF